MATLAIWQRFASKPGGKWAFSRLVCLRAPYFGSIHPRFEELRPEYCRIAIRKRRAVLNHIGTVHAIAMSSDPPLDPQGHVGRVPEGSRHGSGRRSDARRDAQLVGSGRLPSQRHRQRPKQRARIPRDHYDVGDAAEIDGGMILR